jgi:hypothetical protein
MNEQRATSNEGKGEEKKKKVDIWQKPQKATPNPNSKTKTKKQGGGPEAPLGRPNAIALFIVGCWLGAPGPTRPSPK